MSFSSILPNSLSQPSYTQVSTSNNDIPINNSCFQDEELDAAFDEPDDDNHTNANQEDEDDEECHLMGTSSNPAHHSNFLINPSTSTKPLSIPIAYDFERDPYQHLSSSNLNTINNNPSRISSQSITTRSNAIGGGTQNDGVFNNLSAKPDCPKILNPQTGQLEYVGGNDDGNPNDKDEMLPTYDSAALDSSPPYWETTVTLPGGANGPYGILGPDDILVDGLPVGNLFGFAWNLLVSMSFQFIGFLLTYLLHTTHAAKNGSRAGLGITLIQYGLYTRTKSAELVNGAHSQNASRTNHTSSASNLAGDPWGLFGPTSGSSGGDWDGSTGRKIGKGAGMLPYDGPIPAEQAHIVGAANEWLSYVLIAIGWFLLLGGLLNYWRAVRWARAVRSEDMVVGTLA
ncbi:hypothetical protein O181_099361 [Austropuccinia psidii MF-1]|uniref:Metal homeostatis protein bsd2 n=1 Tax=Austropuccinia psidii MF-1 TaxID=1389203 RepID=A0A9Q3JCN9_9BASI|nr:hypothetical protein [Austropuccinia psidii MF-1]